MTIAAAVVLAGYFCLVAAVVGGVLTAIRGLSGRLGDVDVWFVAVVVSAMVTVGWALWPTGCTVQDSVPPTYSCGPLLNVQGWLANVRSVATSLAAAAAVGALAVAIQVHRRAGSGSEPSGDRQAQ